MKWEPSEDQFLRDHYNNLGPTRCGVILVRSSRSITARTHRLGIKMDNPYSTTGVGIDKYGPTLLYLVSFMHNGEKVYKLGITNRDVQDRYKTEYDKLRMRTEWVRYYDTGAEAYIEEQRLLRKYHSSLINTGLLRAGNTETLNTYIELKECN